MESSLNHSRNRSDNLNWREPDEPIKHVLSYKLLHSRVKCIVDKTLAKYNDHKNIKKYKSDLDKFIMGNFYWAIEPANTGQKCIRLIKDYNNNDQYIKKIEVKQSNSIGTMNFNFSDPKPAVGHIDEMHYTINYEELSYIVDLTEITDFVLNFNISTPVFR